MGCYPDEAVENFFRSLRTWEVSVVVDALRTIESHPSKQICSGLLYFMTTHLYIIQNDRILPSVRSKSPDEPFLDWPLSPPPPGIFLRKLAHLSCLCYTAHT